MLIEIENLNKQYFKENSFLKKEQLFNVLQNISFCLEEGTALAIIGESGSGKTTLAKIICRLTDFNSGTVKINGTNINSYSKKEFSNTVQMIFQNSYASFNPKLTIGYSLSEALTDYKGDKLSYITETLKTVGLEGTNITEKYPHQFSGGQRQRIAIARALLKKPAILVADEPFSSLDAVNQALITEIFIKIKKEKKQNIIFITHDIFSAEEICDKFLILKDGKMIKYSSLKEIKEDVSDSYINELVNASYLTE